MTKTKRFFTAIFAFLLCAVSAFGQMRNSTFSEQTIQRLHKLHKNVVSGGVVHPADTTPTTQLATPPILFSADKRVYEPGDEILIKAQNLSINAYDEPIRIYIAETFHPAFGNATMSDYYPCDCGGSNDGVVLHGFGPFESKDLYRRRIQNFRFGQFDFEITVNRFQGNSEVSWFQQQFSVVSEEGPDGFQPGLMFANDGAKVQIDGEPYLVLSGKFPIGQKLYYYIGSLGHWGGFDEAPALSSQDGKTLIVPAFSPSSQKLEGRVWLMTSDIQFTAVSPSFPF